MSLRTPLSRAKGLGSAKDGVHHWWIERLTAVALVPLYIWFVWGLISHAGADYETVAAWIGSPVTAVLLVLLLAVTFHHAQLGMQVVYEDYIHTEWLKLTSIVLTKFIAYVLAAAGIFAVLRVAFGG
ncbi:succinate dehydrogenase, hydrophobic membrane anchor protein [Alkalilimnicola ehrlichii]|uniref:Succinate dehydrogenase hydrophobic membrane anchor subunit n=1 Tax=Alkalilimnicola ehrlichii TaxID=351052 RepID=A0A3E0X212_9GAMM|nr:succinate dehydrogenase, hydrophobic membrane anchor protein [Alkalilimnicola ehrlichii]RFA28357.1 succinate dehydrogenase, hydrophobic membrane anchor protein [Alkalilimnicola ehrlichii]RFA38578.1 succinate dehydrogenase, hydrophobic membrane anchor protein [Alkalilimnicola ehrlichii]